MLSPQSVLYPGCHRHITPSLFFPRVHYVDSDGKVEDIYTDTKALDFVRDNREYAEEPEITFSRKNYSDTLAETSSVDLLISLSAGIVSDPCGQYLREGGHLLVNDSHSDAMHAYLDGRFRLVAVYDDATRSFDAETSTLGDCFRTRKGEEVTQDMLSESLTKARSRCSFKLKREFTFYLFEKKSEERGSYPHDEEDIDSRPYKRQRK